MIEEDIPDIVETLRECAEDSRKSEGDYYSDQFATDASVFDDAADAIEKLRAEIARLRLSDAERECLEWAEELAGNCEEFGRVDTLRGLLERTK